MFKNCEGTNHLGKRNSTKGKEYMQTPCSKIYSKYSKEIKKIRWSECSE
jgi:hypothetical protein